MNIVVCVKQVVDGANIRFDPTTKRLMREGDSSINGFDKNAMEAALQIAEKTQGSVTVLTMGPESAKTTLKECLAMGAAKAVLISGEEFTSSDIIATSYVLTAAIKKIGDFDLIICGKQASEGESSMIGACIAERMGFPLVSCVSDIVEVGAKGRFEREHDDGFQIIETTIPAVLSITKSKSFDPRFAAVRATMKANRAVIPMMTAFDLDMEVSDCGKAGSKVSVLETSLLPPRTQGVMIDNESVSDSVAILMKHMAEAKLV